MKKIFICVLFFSTLQLFSQNNLLDLRQEISENGFTSEYSNRNQGYNIEIENSYVAGFSSNGKMATIQSSVNYYEPDVLFQLFIQDLVTDEIVYKSPQYSLIKYYKIENYTMDQLVEFLTIEKFIAAHENEIQSIYSQYGIVTEQQISLTLLPGRIEGNDFTINVKEIHSDLYELQSAYIQKPVKENFRYSAELNISDRGKKVIDRNTVKDPIFEIVPIGFVKNPEEPRIAVMLGIYLYDMRGNFKLKLRFVGADTVNGFN